MSLDRRRVRPTLEALEGRTLLSLRPGTAQFVANTYLPLRVEQPAVGVAPDGTMTAVWVDGELDGSGKGIYARRFDPSGNPLGSQFRINATTAGDQFSPRLALRSDGSSVVAWLHNPNPGSERPEFYVHARRLDASGARIGDEIVANTALPDNFIIRNPDPRVVLHADGGFSLLFNDQKRNLPPGLPPYIGDFITQSYDAAGNRIGEVNDVLTPADDDGWESYRATTYLAVGADGTIYLPQVERRHRHEFIPDVGPLEHYDTRLLVTPLTPTGHRSA